MSPVDLQQRVAHALAEAGVGAGQSVGVGCSGGPDSAALAHATLALARAGAVGVVVLVHIDHQLRPDSGEDAKVLDELVRHSRGDDGDAGRVVVVEVAVDRRRASLERAAREARYRAFEQIIEDCGLACLLLAHTGSDQAETVLMRTIRGTGVAGLAGIPARRGPYVRPWLSVTRADVEAYVAAHALPTVRDPSNRDLAFFRNRVRHDWLPALRAENPNIDEALRGIAASAQDHRAVLDFAAEALLERARAAPDRVEAAGAEALYARALVAAPSAVTARALALAAERAGGEPLSSKHVRALQRLLAGPDAGTRTLDLPGLRALRVYDILRFEVPAPTARALPVVRVTGPDAPYLVRTWAPGDRMRPARLRGRSRKLSDLYTDAKVPRGDRRAAVVVVRPADRTIVWAQHIGAAFEEPVDVVLTSPLRGARNRLNERG